MFDPHSHIAGSADHRAQTVTSLCGRTKPLSESGAPGEPPAPGKPACAACYFEMFKLTQKDTADYMDRLGGIVNDLRGALYDVAQQVASEHDRSERGLTNLLDALESAEARLDALERKAKKGRRS